MEPMDPGDFGKEALPWPKKAPKKPKKSPKKAQISFKTKKQQNQKGLKPKRLKAKKA
jgi:hypothetical protein